MQQAKLILEMMRSLQTKALAFRDAFPPGSMLDRESPVYLALMQSLKGTAASVKQIDAGLDDQLHEMLKTLAKKKQELKDQADKLSAQQKAQQQKRAAADKAALGKMEKQGMPTLPFEKAYAPSTARLQHLITRFSQIGHSTMVKHASQQTNRFSEQPRA